MTKEKLNKTKLIFVANKHKRFHLNDKVDKKMLMTGTNFRILYGDEELTNHIASNSIYFDYREGTDFNTFEEAKKFIQEHRSEIALAMKDRYNYLARKWDSNKCQYFIPSDLKFKISQERKRLTIEGKFVLYYDTFNHRETYCEEVAKKWYKNSIFFQRERPEILADIDAASNSFTLVTEEPESVVFEQYGIIWVEDEEKGYKIPKFTLYEDVPVIRAYKDKFMRVRYNERTHKYEDVCEIFAEDSIFTSYSRSWYGADETQFFDGYDLSSPIIKEGKAREFSEETKALLKTKLNAPDFVPESPSHYYGSTPDDVRNTYSLARALLKRRVPYHDNETKICKEITEFCMNIPFDEEHSVIKYKNGYILRLGAITQIFKRTTVNINNETKYDYRTRFSEGENVEVVQEQYMEYARLFVNNTLTTRSLSICQDGGKCWVHEGIHLITNLFQATPEHSSLGIDVEDRNRKALEKLYTVHPKLKYMKKYMEKHPDVLYNSCVPFLRAIFQYNVILETFISLGKDSIFWTPIEERSRSYYRGYRSSDQTYKGTTETFDMSDFIETLQLTRIPQKGDFYQRLGLTRQQFKLIFEDLNLWSDIATVLFKIKFRYKSDGSSCIRTIKRDGSYDYPPNFRYVSYEEVRLVVEVIKVMLTSNEHSYWIANKIERLYELYGSFQRVYKAIVVKKYDTELLQDYLNMRIQLRNFPDFKESIWDIFPTDNEDLQRSHTRITFLNNLKVMYEGVVQDLINMPLEPHISTVPDLYAYTKEHGLEIVDLHELFQLVRKIIDLTSYRNDSFFSKRDLFQQLPKNEEELEQMKEHLVSVHKTFANLHYIYWEEDQAYRYPSSYAASAARERWGNQSYLDFLKTRLSSGLDMDKYDLYVRLRRKFLDNDSSFEVNNYPLILATEDELEKLYNELAAKEPALDHIIEERERLRREQIQRENEERVAGAQHKYVERYKKLKQLNYNDDEERCIVVPKNLVSLIVEGQTLHHCVGSFVDSVAEGKDTIVFLRKKADVDQPYATINLLPNGNKWFIDQAHTDSNGPITDEDVAFLKKWGEAKGIMQESITRVYGAKCHH